MMLLCLCAKKIKYRNDVKYFWLSLTFIGHRLREKNGWNTDLQSHLIYLLVLFNFGIVSKSTCQPPKTQGQAGAHREGHPVK